MAEKKKEEGNKAYQNGDFADAIKKYSDAIQLDDLNAVYYGNRAAAYMQLKDYEQARADSKKAVALDDTYVKGFLRLAQAEKELGDKDAALQAVRAGMALADKGAKKTGLGEFKKIERQLKANERAARADSARAAQLDENVGRLDPEQTMQQLGRKRVSCKYKLGDTQHKIRARAREQQEKQIVIDVLQNRLTQENAGMVYRRVGKAYLMSECKQALQAIKKEKTTLESEEQMLKRMETRFKSELKDAEALLFEYQKAQFQAQQAQAAAQAAQG